MDNEREDNGGQAIPNFVLEREIMDSGYAKNYREWWAKIEIERLREALPIFPQPLSEEEILDFLDSWGYRHGNMPKCNDDDFRKIAQAISTHFCKPRISVEALERIIEGFRNKLPLMLIGYEETKLLAIAIHKRMEL